MLAEIKKYDKSVIFRKSILKLHLPTILLLQRSSENGYFTLSLRKATVQKECMKDSNFASGEVITHFTTDFKSTNFNLDTNKIIKKYYCYMHYALMPEELPTLLWSTPILLIYPGRVSIQMTEMVGDINLLSKLYGIKYQEQHNSQKETLFWVR